MNRKEFFEKVAKVVAIEGLSKIQWAYLLAKEVHRRQKRDEGERYFEHCRRAAILLLECGKTSAKEIIMALLHDCIEDGYISKEMIDAIFGKEIADGVGLLSKCENVVDEYGFVKKIKKHKATYYHTIGLADISVRRVKVADRLDNLRNMSVWSKSKRAKYLIETEVSICNLLCCYDCGGKLFGALINEVKKIKMKGGEK